MIAFDEADADPYDSDVVEEDNYSEIPAPVVHVYPYNEHWHVLAGWPKIVCECNPTVSDYRKSGGGVIVAHTQQMQ